VTAYNRSPDKVQALVGQGGRAAGTVAEACAGDVVFSMLADDDAVAAVTLGDGGILACPMDWSAVGSLAARDAAAGSDHSA